MKFSEGDFDALTYAIRLGVSERVRKTAFDEALSAYRNAIVEHLVEERRGAAGAEGTWDEVPPPGDPRPARPGRRQRAGDGQPAKAARPAGRLRGGEIGEPTAKRRRRAADNVMADPKPAPDAGGLDMNPFDDRSQEAADDPFDGNPLDGPFGESGGGEEIKPREPEPLMESLAEPAPEPEPEQPDPVPEPAPRAERAKPKPLPDVDRLMTLDQIIEHTGIDRKRFKDLYDAGKVISVKRKGTEKTWMFPVAQFGDDMEPHPCVGLIMAKMNGDGNRAWDWLCEPHGYLEGHLPIVAAADFGDLVAGMIDELVAETQDG